MEKWQSYCKNNKITKIEINKMLFVPFVFSKSRFQGPTFRCDKIVVIETALEAVEGIPDNIVTFGGTKTSTTAS